MGWNYWTLTDSVFFFFPWHKKVPVTFYFWFLSRALFWCPSHFFENCRGHFDNVTGTTRKQKNQRTFWEFEKSRKFEKLSTANFIFPKIFTGTFLMSQAFFPKMSRPPKKMSLGKNKNTALYNKRRWCWGPWSKEL